MSTPKKIDLLREGVYQSLWTGNTVSHVGIFDQTSNLLSVFNSPPYPHFPVWISTHVYTYTVCKGGYKHLPQIPFTGQFFQMTTFSVAFYESYLSTVWTIDIFVYKANNFCVSSTFCWQGRIILWNITIRVLKIVQFGYISQISIRKKNTRGVFQQISMVWTAHRLTSHASYRSSYLSIY